MAQYQILTRKPLGPSGTGPKQTLEVKTVSQHRLGFASPRPHDGALPPTQRAAQGCTLRAPPRVTRAKGSGHLRAHRAQVGCRRRAAPCATIAHGGRPVGASRDAARSYSAHDSARYAQLQRLAPTSFTGKLALQRLAAVVLRIAPRLKSRLLRQSALEDLTNLSRTESPRQGDRNKSNHEGGGTRRRVEEAAAEEEKWGREAATS
ncbi:hypothetical protein F511_14801 [Dorcoceras hygrometricum]|uniref:Uncharacterized protein n=1 Tax=Dorcoceras hygrometricum TaxID=472368 RepID=A0A2Z7CEH2_9LAMI|nr:hypothetical protein F511_14801 [Dorcoceras hygrometricum]